MQRLLILIKSLTKAVTDAQKKFDDAKTEADKNTALSELRTAEDNLSAYIQPLEDAVDGATTDVTNWENSLKTGIIYWLPYRVTMLQHMLIY